MDRPDHDGGVSGLVSHLFRHQSGRLVAVLTRALGARHLPLVEDAVQEALMAALRLWPLHGIPDNPPAWLLQVARRRVFDVLRRTQNFELRVAPHLTSSEAPVAPEGDDLDAVLALMFMTCHPALSPELRLALTLKVAGGFSVEEIAHGLLADPRAVAQRLVRAKRQLRDLDVPAEVPPPELRAARLDSVHEAIALLFTIGYGPRDGDLLIRDDLCYEALRLVRLLVRHPASATPDSHALAALLLLQAARLPARVSEGGSLVLLGHQNRTLWLQPLIHEGLQHLDRAATGQRLSRWHLQAGIAALHLAGPHTPATWTRIVALYDDLRTVHPTPVVALNRAIAIGMRDGPSAGLAALAELAPALRLADYHLLHAATGHFHDALGDRGNAAEAFTRALMCPISTPERQYLQARLAAVT